MTASPGLVLLPLVLLPAAAAVACWFIRRPRAALAVCLACVAVHASLASVVVASVFRGAPLFAARGWLFLDALSPLHLAALDGVFLLCTLLAWEYFGEEIRVARFDRLTARRFSSLWLGSLATMS